MDCVDDPNKWTPFKLTNVVYPKGDKLGELFAAVSLTPFAILVGFATLILFRRDLHTIFFAAGIFVNEAVNWILKHWFREQRPCFGRHNWVEFGMPSSHAQFMWFFTLYLLLFLSVSVYLGYHTWRQVLFGSFIGGASGGLWFCLINWVLTPIFPWITSLRISEMLMIRDCTPIPNITFFEYSYTRVECRKRSRKSSFHRH